MGRKVNVIAFRLAINKFWKKESPLRNFTLNSISTLFKYLLVKLLLRKFCFLLVSYAFFFKTRTVFCLNVYRYFYVFGRKPKTKFPVSVAKIAIWDQIQVSFFKQFTRSLKGRIYTLAFKSKKQNLFFFLRLFEHVLRLRFSYFSYSMVNVYQPRRKNLRFQSVFLKIPTKSSLGSIIKRDIFCDLLLKRYTVFWKKLNVLWWKQVKLKLEIRFSNILRQNVWVQLKNVLGIVSRKRKRLFRLHCKRAQKKLWYLKKYKHIKDTINIVNISTYLGNSQLLATQISKEFRFNKKHKHFIFSINDIVTCLHKYRFFGRFVKLGVKGKVHGKPRSKRFFVLKKRVLCQQTIGIVYDFALVHCLTKYGVFSISVWIFTKKYGK